MPYPKKIDTPEVVCLLFSSTSNVACKSLRAELGSMLIASFPEIEFLEIQSEYNARLAGRFHVYYSPTILLLINGKEMLRKTNSFNVSVLKQEIKRYYNLLFTQA